MKRTVKEEVILIIEFPVEIGANLAAYAVRLLQISDVQIGVFDHVKASKSQKGSYVGADFFSPTASWLRANGHTLTVSLSLSFLSFSVALSLFLSNSVSLSHSLPLSVSVRLCACLALSLSLSLFLFSVLLFSFSSSPSYSLFRKNSR